MSILNKLFGKSKNGELNSKNESSERTLLLPNKEFQGVQLHERFREKITNKIVEIDSKEFVGSFKECHFIDCEIKIRCSGKYTGVMTSGCTFESCLIWAHTKQNFGNWNSTFNSCSFKGRFQGRFEKKLTNCDLSLAKIDIIALLSNNDFEEVKGIIFPNIAILNAKENLERWKNVEKPDDYEDLVWASAIEPKTMVIMNLKEHTKDPDKLWKAIEHLEFVKTSHNTG